VQEARAEIALGFFHGAFATAPGAAPHLNSVPVSACYLQGRLRWDAHLDQRLIGEFPCYFPVLACYFGRFPAFALILLRICILPAPPLQGFTGTLAEVHPLAETRRPERRKLGTCWISVGPATCARSAPSARRFDARRKANLIRQAELAPGVRQRDEYGRLQRVM
jgi:hypothetical protein